MNLLYISSFMFNQDGDFIYGLPSCSDAFFQKYLDVFDRITVIGNPFKSYLDKNNLVKIQDKRINIIIVPNNTRPKDFKNDRLIKKVLNFEINKAEAILIKPASRKGMMAISISNQLNKPYMIEMTGDLANALQKSDSLVKKIYSPIIYHKIRKSIKKCGYGLYVSTNYLQKRYPIKGIQCGCSDVVLVNDPSFDLSKRIERNKNIYSNFLKGEIINIALIGFYQGKLKGVDVAIKSLSKLPEFYHLSILGNGTEENRKKWFNFAKKNGVNPVRVHFPTPLANTSEVLTWLDSIDFLVHPTLSEGFGRCVAEAMSRGVVCFATNICTMPELLPTNCLHKIRKYKDLSRLILMFSKNINLMNETSIINYKKSKDYEFSVLTERRNKFLNSFKNYCESFNSKEE